jgi:hypothetical protein
LSGIEQLVGGSKREHVVVCVVRRVSAFRAHDDPRRIFAAKARQIVNQSLADLDGR